MARTLSFQARVPSPRCETLSSHRTRLRAAVHADALPVQSYPCTCVIEFIPVPPGELRAACKLRGLGAGLKIETAADDPKQMRQVRCFELAARVDGLNVVNSHAALRHFTRGLR